MAILSTILHWNSSKNELICSKSWKIAGTGGFSPRPPGLRRLGALPPDPQHSVTGIFAPNTHNWPLPIAPRSPRSGLPWIIFSGNHVFGPLPIKIPGYASDSFIHCILFLAYHNSTIKCTTLNQKKGYSDKTIFVKTCKKTKLYLQSEY